MKNIIASFFVVFIAFIGFHAADAAPPPGKDRGWHHGHDRDRGNWGKGKSNRGGGWRDLWRVIGAPLSTSVPSKEAVDGSKVTVIFATGEAQVEFPGKAEAGWRAVPGLKIFIFRDPDEGMVYSFTVYGDPARFGFSGDRPDAIIKSAQDRFSALESKLGVKGEQKQTSEHGETIWDAQLAKAPQGKGPPAALFQRVVVGSDLFVVATVLARTADDVGKAKVTEFFNSILLSAPEKKDVDALPKDEPYWPAVIKDSGISEWPGVNSDDESQDLFLALPRGDEEDQE